MAFALYYYKQQGITNTLALPIDKMLYIYLLCPHSEHQNNRFHYHQRDRVPNLKQMFNKVKLPKVGSSAIWGTGPNQFIQLRMSWTPILVYLIAQKYKNIVCFSFLVCPCPDQSLLALPYKAGILCSESL
jgi:hypothetical protein